MKPVVQEKKPAPKKAAAVKPVEREDEEEKIENELERKLRLQQAQEDADHDNAVALFGSDFISKTKPSEEAKAKVVVKQVDWLESLDPVSLKDFDSITDHLSKALRKFEVNAA